MNENVCLNSEVSEVLKEIASNISEIKIKTSESNENILTLLGEIQVLKIQCESLYDEIYNRNMNVENFYMEDILISLSSTTEFLEDMCKIINEAKVRIAEAYDKSELTYDSFCTKVEDCISED